MRQLECCGGPTVVVRLMSKTGAGNFFEDFRIGQVIRHATPRTVTVGDVALYNGLFGPRFAVQSSDAFARATMGDAQPLIQALRKLTEKNLSNLMPHPLYSGFYYSHPTLLERERALQTKT